jgi:glucan biosynthesis protein C
MLLGLVIHAAAPYRDIGGWLVDEPGGSTLLTTISTWIYTFRMPAFFLLAGLLSAWALDRRSGPTFLARRAGRLLLPLLVCAATLNMLQQSWLEAEAARRCVLDAPCAVNLPVAAWLGHLWFLLDLFVYTVILVAAAPLLTRLAAAAERRLGALPRAIGIGALLVLPFAALFAWSLAVGAATFAFDGLDRPWLGFWSFTWVADHLFFFVAGALLACSAAFRRRLGAEIPLALPVATGVLGTLAFVARGSVDLPRGSAEEKVVFELVEAIPTVLLTAFAVTACLRLHQHVRPLAARMARWSYSVYLFHHVVAVVVATLLLDVALPAPAKFAITLAAVATLPLLAAASIERSRVLTLLFNGEWRVPAPADHAGSPSAAAVPAAAPGTGAWVLEILETPVRTVPAAPAPADEPSRDRLAG